MQIPFCGCPFTVLGLGPQATKAEVVREYRRLILQVYSVKKVLICYEMLICGTQCFL